MRKFTPGLIGVFTRACVVLSIVIANSGCGVESTAENSSTISTIALPHTGALFKYHAFGTESSAGAVSRSSVFLDSVESVLAVDNGAELDFPGGARLTISNNDIVSSGEFLIPRVVGVGLDDQPFRLPIDRSGYSITRDTLIESNGFPVANGTYVESAQRIGEALRTIGDSTYRIWQYRSVHAVSYTIISGEEIADTIYADFAPQLGYFTHLEEIRTFRSSTFDGYHATISLDSVLFNR